MTNQGQKQGQGSEGQTAGGIKSENRRDQGLTNKGEHGDTGVGDKKLSNQTDKKTGTDEPGQAVQQ